MFHACTSEYTVFSSQSVWWCSIEHAERDSCQRHVCVISGGRYPQGAPSSIIIFIIIITPTTFAHTLHRAPLWFSIPPPVFLGSGPCTLQQPPCPLQHQICYRASFVLYCVPTKHQCSRDHVGCRPSSPFQPAQQESMHTSVLNKKNRGQSTAQQ